MTDHGTVRIILAVWLRVGDAMLRILAVVLALVGLPAGASSLTYESAAWDFEITIPNPTSGSYFYSEGNAIVTVTLGGQTSTYSGYGSIDVAMYSPGDYNTVDEYPVDVYVTFEPELEFTPFFYYDTPEPPPPGEGYTFSGSFGAGQLTIDLRPVPLPAGGLLLLGGLALLPLRRRVTGASAGYKAG